MVNSFLLPTIATLLLISAFALFFAKQRSPELSRDLGKTSQPLFQKKRTFSDSQKQKPTKSSNKLRTRRDLLIEEHGRLSLSGLGLNKLIGDFNPSSSNPYPDSISNQYLMKIYQVREDLKQERDAISMNGLGPRHPRMLQIATHLESLAQNETIILEYKKKTPSQRESAFLKN